MCDMALSASEHGDLCLTFQLIMTVSFDKISWPDVAYVSGWGMSSHHAKFLTDFINVSVLTLFFILKQ